LNVKNTDFSALIRINLPRVTIRYILSLTNEKLTSTLLWIYLLVSIGVAMQVGAANWDIIWHGVVNVESFFTPPHLVLYSGVGLTLIATITAIVISIKHNGGLNKQLTLFHKIPNPLKLIALGCIIEVFSGQFDSWWHTNFGFDGLLSPPHLMLISGMLLSIIGALIGTYLSDTQKKFKIISQMISYGILWMILINFVFMFTLPFSEGQYFDFNPSPTVALVLGSTLPPAFTAIIFYSVQSLPFAFRMTFVAATLMTLQSLTTIISNSYFIGLFPLYLLNLLVPVSLDIISIYAKKNNISLGILSNEEYKRIIFSIAIAFFFITIYFPWSVNMFKVYFGIDQITFESVIILEQLLWKFILPVLMPVSLISSFLAILIWKKFYGHQKLINVFKVVS
jgi:hypothetical protein